MLSIYIFSIILLIVAPGANMMLILGIASTAGSGAARRAALGLTCGVLCHTALAATGGSFALQRWPDALQFIQVLGGLVLIWIGGQMLYRQLRWQPTSTQADRHDTPSPFAQGVVSSLSNVKTLVLFVSFLPQFFAVDQPVAVQFVLHGGIYALLTLIIYATIGSVAGVFAATLQRPLIQRGVRAVAGIVIMVFGVQGVLV
jgi:threonine/homoserine/homoserine lactone efflux protein